VANRRISSRRIRAHLTYSVAEAADVTGSHRNTVRHWLRSGLQPVDDRQPTIIKGAIFKAFIDARKAKRRQPCGPGRLYCLKCRAPKRPAFGEVEYEADTPKLGRLIGICPDCERLIHRCASKHKLRDSAGDLTVRFRREAERLHETLPPNLNCDSNKA
jgi:hypothetical protein